MLFGDEKVNNEELRRVIESKNLFSINYVFILEFIFEIKYSMLLLKEFWGVVRDLMYLKKMMYLKKIKCR